MPANSVWPPELVGCGVVVVVVEVLEVVDGTDEVVGSVVEVADAATTCAAVEVAVVDFWVRSVEWVLVTAFADPWAPAPPAVRPEVSVVGC